jgi:hypothetical protein
MRSSAVLRTGLIVAGAHRAAHGPAADSCASGHFPERMARIGQRHHALVAGLPSRFDRGVLTLQTGRGAAGVSGACRRDASPSVACSFVAARMESATWVST